MGSLVVVDASLLAGWLSPADRHHQISTAALNEAQSAGNDIVIPASAFSEVLVHPYAHGETTGRQAEERLMLLGAVAPISAAIGSRAARLRTLHKGLRTPDALVIATGIELAARETLTLDKQWQAIDPSRIRYLLGDNE